MSSSVVEIRVGGVDYTNHCIWDRAHFEFNQNAVPGTFEITLRDLEQSIGPFTTGDEIELLIDGDREYGGYVTQVSRTFVLPADKIPTTSRAWVLRGVDYNIMFDKRVTRRPANYLRHLPFFHGDDFDGDLITFFCNNYIDLPPGFEAGSQIDNVAYPFFETSPDPDRVGGWKQQGTVWREQMELMAQWSGAVWYVDPDKVVHYHALETATADFGLSDDPDGTTTVGVRDVTATEDASGMVNDAFVWGGSEWTQGVVFARAERSTSIDDHGRWQYAEHHFGEDGYKLQRGVDGRADLIVDGHSTIVGYNPGKRFPQWEVQATWFGENVPAGADHLRAGELVTIDLTTFGGALSPIVLPCRSVNVSFVGVDVTGNGHVKFDGQFGLSLDDPFTIWGYLRALRHKRTSPVAAADDTITESTYGSFGQFTPISLGGGVYDLPNDLGYVGGTTTVYHQGVLLAKGTDYTESDPVSGEITLSITPTGWLKVVCRTT
jgi:hypothetical protein